MIIQPPLGAETFRLRKLRYDHHIRQRNNTMEIKSFKDLKGRTITDIKGLIKCSFTAEFTLSDGTVVLMNSYEHSCGHDVSVTIEDVVGDISDLLNSEILLAEEISNKPSDEDDRIKSWTFYKLSTIKGSVTVRWYGESNGYYGTGVDISEKEEED